MNLLIKSATISDPGSPFYQQVVDVLIEKGQIVKIAKKIDSDIEAFDARGKHLSPGFLTSIATSANWALRPRRT